MTYVVGDATHLRGMPLSGTPSTGDVIRYDGQTIAFASDLTLALFELARNRRNIQLLFLQQSIAENMARGDAADGFYDAFQDQSGVDPETSTARYDQGEFYAAPAEPTGPAYSRPTANSHLNRFDARGLITNWYQDSLNTGHFEGEEAGFDSEAVTSESGGTKTGFPAANHGLTVGMKVRFSGFSTGAYNATHTVDSATTADKVVIAVAYQAETMGSGRQRRRVLTLGADQECPYVVVGQQVDVGSGVPRSIIAIDETTKGAGTGKVTLNRELASCGVSGIYGSSLWYGAVSPHRGYSVPVGTWSAPNPGAKPPTRILSRMAHDPINQWVWLSCGRWYDNGTVRYKNDIWAYDPATSAWTEFIPSGTPPCERCSGFMEYDPVNHALILYGGYTHYQTPNRVFDTWKYDIAANAWTNLSPTGTPTVSEQVDGDYDRVNHCMWIFGGRDVNGTPIGQLWKYDIAANTWTQVSPSGSSPSARDGVAMRYDPVGHCLWLFGGGVAPTTYNDVWKYDIAANAWTQLSPTGTPPSTRRLACRGFDPLHGDFFVYSGVDAAGIVGAFFTYNVMTNAWTTLSTTGGPFDRGRGRAVFDQRSGRFYTGFGGDATFTVNQYNDMYEYAAYDLRGPESAAVFTTTDDTQIDAPDMLHVSSVSVSQTTPGLSTIHHAVSFDGRESWMIRRSGGWTQIARLSDGVWQYQDDQGAWESAESNTMTHALEYAFAVPANLMTWEQLAAVSQSQWEEDGGFSPQVNTIDFASVMRSDAGEIPALVRYEVSWTTGLDLVSTAKTLAAASSRMCASALLKNKHDSTRVYVSADDGETWSELTGLSQAATLANGVFQYASDWTAVAGGNRVRIRVASDAGHGTEVHGWVVACDAWCHP